MTKQLVRTIEKKQNELAVLNSVTAVIVAKHDKKNTELVRVFSKHIQNIESEILILQGVIN